jgi:hypothetical protein
MPKRPYPSRADLEKLSTEELQAMCREVTRLDIRSTRSEYLISRIRSSLAARAMGSVVPKAAPDDRPPGELTVYELRTRFQEVLGRPTNSYRKKYLREKISEALRGCIPIGPRSLRSPYGSVPEYKFFTLRFSIDIAERIDELWPRLGFSSRMDLFRAALHDYLLQAGEHESAAIFDPWLQMYDDDTTPV